MSWPRCCDAKLAAHSRYGLLLTSDTIIPRILTQYILVPRPTPFFCSSASDTRMRGCGRAAKNTEGLVSFITSVTSGGHKGGRRGGGGGGGGGVVVSADPEGCSSSSRLG